MAPDEFLTALSFTPGGVAAGPSTASEADDEVDDDEGF